MENEIRTYFNSPVIRNNTPLRRLGLSRKRKSCSSPNVLSPKIQVCDETYPDTPTSSFTDSQKSLERPEPSCSKNCDDGDNPVINYDDEIELLKRKISDAEEKLKTLQCNNDNIKQLEELIEVWKSGCKRAYVQFSEFVQKRQMEDDDFKALLNKLGILETLSENFNSDPEILLPE